MLVGEQETIDWDGNVEDFLKFDHREEKFRDSLGTVRRARAIERRGGRRRRKGHRHGHRPLGRKSGGLQLNSCQRDATDLSD